MSNPALSGMTKKEYIASLERKVVKLEGMVEVYERHVSEAILRLENLMKKVKMKEDGFVVTTKGGRI